MARKPVVHVEDDEWIEITWRKQREMCCDCHLVHDVDYRMKGNRLQFRANVNRRATSAARRGFRFETDSDE